MFNGKIILIQLVALVLLIITVGGAMCAEKPAQIFVPTTISEEAKAVIENVRPVEANAKTVGEWRKLFKEREDLVIKLNESFKTAFPGKVEEVEIAGYKHLLITPQSYDPINKDRLIIQVHGGGYVFYSAESSLNTSLMMGHYSRTKVLSLNYPLSWEKPFPAQRDLVVAVYEKMLEKYAPQYIAMFGESAGGGAVVTAVLKIRDDGVPMPAVVGLISPWVDLGNIGDSMTIVKGRDPMLDYELNVKTSALLYADGRDLKDSAVSPIYADYKKGFPPSYISTGTRDLFLSHCARLQRKLTDAGVENRLYVYEGMWHVFQLFPIPESEPAWRDMVDFFNLHMGR